MTKKIMTHFPQALELFKNFTTEENIKYSGISLGYESEINQKVETIEELENWEKITKISFKKVPNPQKVEEFVAEKILENVLEFVKFHSKNGATIEFEKKIDEQIKNIM